jgi:hypothetical protein
MMLYHTIERFNAGFNQNLQIDHQFWASKCLALFVGRHDIPTEKYRYIMKTQRKDTKGAPPLVLLRTQSFCFRFCEI